MVGGFAVRGGGKGKGLCARTKRGGGERQTGVRKGEGREGGGPEEEGGDKNLGQKYILLATSHTAAESRNEYILYI